MSETIDLDHVALHYRRLAEHHQKEALALAVALQNALKEAAQYRQRYEALESALLSRQQEIEAKAVEESKAHEVPIEKREPWPSDEELYEVGKMVGYDQAEG